MQNSRIIKKAIFVSLCSMVISINIANADNPRAKKKIFIGALEKLQDNWPSLAKEDTNYIYKIRLVFIKKNDKWETMKKYLSSEEVYPKSVKWVIYFNGKDLGQFASKEEELITKYKWTLPRDKFHIPTDEINLSLINIKRNKLYHWGGKFFTPYILVSENSYKNDFKWKKYIASNEIINRCKEEFKNTLGEVTYFYYDSETLTEKNIAVEYDVKDIKLSDSYLLKNNEYLLALTLDDTLYKGAMKIQEEEWLSQWFYINKENVIVHIGSNMDFIDCGDYDNSGESEFIFWTSGYNRDGYVMFCDNFNRKVEFIWGYH